jgi:5'-3' exonuclease
MATSAAPASRSWPVGRETKGRLRGSPESGPGPSAGTCKTPGMDVHLVDGTYELFRQFFGQPPRAADDGTEIGAARGVVLSVMSMLADGATHLGVATDHVIESFRNDLWTGYKTGAGIEPALRSQFEIVETALEALGVGLWPMVELEADDALASAASVAAEDPEVDRVIICTPDKDLAQCVVGERVVQLDRRSGTVTGEDGVWDKFGVAPRSIPDWLALVGDSADGFPGLPGWGAKSAAAVLAAHHHLAEIPDAPGQWQVTVRGAPKLAATLAQGREAAELFLELATLRVDRSLLGSVDELEWRGPTEEFDEVCAYMADRSLVGRVAALVSARGAGY